MMFRFKKILIPADLSINTEVAVQKGLALADAHTTIHLLYVHNRVRGYTSNNLEALRGKENQNGLKDPINRLEHLKEYIESNSPGVQVYTWVGTNDSVQMAIEEKAKELEVDLVVIG